MIARNGGHETIGRFWLRQRGRSRLRNAAKVAGLNGTNPEQIPFVQLSGVQLDPLLVNTLSFKLHFLGVLFESIILE